MSEETLYMIADPSGALYGPANIATLRQWIAEGRITSQMLIAPQGTQNFTPASQIPELLTAFSSALAAPTASTNQPYPNSAYQQSYNAPYYGKSSGMAIASLVCALCGIFFCGIPAIVGIILGHMARAQIRRNPDRYDGMGLATAGMIVGYCLIGLYALVLLVIIISAIVSPSSMRGLLNPALTHAKPPPPATAASRSSAASTRQTQTSTPEK